MQENTGKEDLEDSFKQNDDLLWFYFQTKIDFF